MAAVRHHREPWGVCSTPRPAQFSGKVCVFVPLATPLILPGVWSFLHVTLLIYHSRFLPGAVFDVWYDLLERCWWSPI